MKPIFRIAVIAIAAAGCRGGSGSDWAVFGGNKENNHYAALTQIDTNNVSSLAVAWEYHTGDADTAHHSQIQCNPLIVDGVLFGTTPTLRLFALKADNGKKIWEFNPDSAAAAGTPNFGMNNCRGVCYWSAGKDKRILYTAGSFLFAVDAVTGQPVRSFGNNGKIDLHDGLGREVQDLYVAATSPGIIYKDLFILGSRVDEGAAAAPGHIRAYDVRTGAIKWIFHTIPQPGEYGYETWEDSIAYKHIGGSIKTSCIPINLMRSTAR